MEGDIHAFHTCRVVSHAHPPSCVIILGVLDDQTLTNSENAVVCFGNRVQLVMVLSEPPVAQTAPLVTTEITNKLTKQRNGL
jgi:hypothetical protein